MKIRRTPRIRMIARIILASLITGLLMTAGAVTGTAAPASAATQITLCLKNSKSFCADVKDSNDVSGQPVWLHSTSGANDYHWVKVPIPCGGKGDCILGCDAVQCYAFEDAQKPSLCLAASGSQGIELINCGLGTGLNGTPRAAWAKAGTDGSELKNLFWASGGYLTVFGPLANRNPLYVTVIGGASGEWQKWTGQ
jgi:hypothetical protein